MTKTNNTLKNTFKLIKQNIDIDLIIEIEEFDKITEEFNFNKDQSNIVFEIIYFFYKEKYKKNIFCLKTGNLLSKLRKENWRHNYGVPPLLFSLKFNHIFSAFAKEPKLTNKIIQDVINQFFIKSNGADNIEYPVAINGFVKTYNKQGYMTTTLDRFSNDFVCLPQKSNNKLKLLEIGAAYGVATIEALNNGAIVFANDIEPIHLEVMKKTIKKENLDNIVLLAAEFPCELNFEEDFFDGILISRVLHFFSGQDIVNALTILRKWLKPGGYLYIINETPYLSNWQNFLPEYQLRKKSGLEWPGEITNPKDYGNARTVVLPGFIHWLDYDTLKNGILKAGFVEDEIKDIGYINRKGQFPDDLLMSSLGKESVGCCIKKKTNIM